MKDIPIISINTERLTLKPLGLDFLSKIYLSWMQDDQVVHYMDTGGADYTLQMLEDYLKNIENNKIFSWAIILKNTNQHIGNIKIDPINYRHLYGEYGIMIGDKTTWGKGYAKEASIAVINFCFTKLSLRKINLGVIANNAMALSLYRSLGFVEEGRLKKHELINGTYKDKLRMALFRDFHDKQHI